MSTTTSSYSNLLDGMWAPDGSDMSERLKRLQNLEKIRKEREAKRKAAFNDAGKGTTIVRTTRIQSSDPESETSSRRRYRRAFSLRDEDTDNYGGARPKLGGYSTYGQEDNQNAAGLFSGITASILGPRKPLRGAGEFSSRSRLGSSDSDDSTTSSTYSKRNYEYTTPTFNNTENSYSRSFSKPEVNTEKNMFSGVSNTLRSYIPGYESRSYTSRVGNNPEVENEQNDFGDYTNEHESNVFENGDQNENTEEEDHGEEPKHFIERLKYGNGNSQSETNNTGKHIQSIPTVPPFKQRDMGSEIVEVTYQDMPELVQPAEDILSVAQEISTTFGNLKSPTYATPKKDSRIAVDPNVSVTYDIQTVDYDSSGDEEGKMLPVRESMYHASTSEWNVLDQTPGQLDQMQEFFTGEAPGEDPNISRELDGERVKAELEKSISNVQTPKSSRNNARKTPTSVKRNARKDNKINRSKSPLDKLKSSESENDSVATSESENDTRGIRATTPRKATTPISAKKGAKNGMSLSDKLAKLETLTQEKKRKHSFGENEIKKPVPSYMSETNASQKKKARGKDASPKPSRDLKKDVRELKQFVHEHASEPSTPVTSPTKQFTEFVEITNIEKKASREISVQTEFVIDFPDINFVCKHCGKSSFEEVQSSLLTKENLSKVLGQKTKRDSPDSEKAKPSEIKISSKDSVKSFGETSTKSERGYRYKPKAVSGTQGYMKGTTSSRLRSSSSNLSETDGKARKGSAPEIIHRAELESAKGTTSLKGIVSQKTKAIESSSKKERNTPTLSLFRGSSVERNKPDTSNKTSQLAKSKSVDHVNFIKKELENTADNKEQEIPFIETKVKQNETSPVNNVQPSPGEKRSATQMKQKASSPPKVAPKPKPQAVEKLDLSSLDSPRSPMSPRSTMSLKKPPLASPRVKDTESSPRSQTSEVIDDDSTSVESKGQFTTIDNNPFIKNDTRRRNSLRDHDKDESVWEKAESRSRDSSLKRSNSINERERERPSSASSLKRHNTSAGEKSSVSELTWSDSGSAGSLRGSKSSLHGSNSSLNREGTSAFHRPRTVSTSSTTSQTSQNAMLNLLSPIGTTRHPVSGAMETDVDAAYNDHASDTKTEEHNEESVNRAHLEFAKKACDMLEFEMKKRDSSNESDKGAVKQPQDVTPKIQQSAKIPAPQPGSHGNKTEVTTKGQSSSATASSGIHGNKDVDDEEELVVDTRVKFREWDPCKLLAKLYEVKMMPDNIEDISHKFIGMEGLMEKLPMNKKKATLLKTWKRRFFRAQDGWLHYYETGNKDKPSDSLQLMGGKVEELGPRVLGVDDGRGKYLMVRVPTDHEYGLWKVALESQTADNVKATYVRPSPASIPHPKKKVVIIDIGSSGIRAGILGERATLPQVFFPSIIAVHNQTGEIVVGADALRPDVRRSSKVSQPIQPTNKVDKGRVQPFNIDMAVMKAILQKVFADLKVNQSQYLVMLSTPQNLGDKLREGLMRILVDEMRVQGVCMVQQSLLALYSYNAMSGIIVDIGERLEILPIYDGLLIEGGVSRQAYGGAKIQDSLNISLLENKYQFSSFVEKLLVRYICEEACYVTDNYKETKEKCDADPNSYSRVVDCTELDLPEGAFETVDLDYGCFKSPEGFFNTDLWEMDYKNIQKQIYAAIQQCPMDSRKQMYRSIYLSGGVTTIPGFAERLQEEMRKLAPPAAVVEVHASPQRYHSAYIGACSVASMDVFEMSCVSADEWKKMGVKACRKWGTG